MAFLLAGVRAGKRFGPGGYRVSWPQPAGEPGLGGVQHRHGHVLGSAARQPDIEECQPGGPGAESEDLDPLAVVRVGNDADAAGRAVEVEPVLGVGGGPVAKRM
jgi:hypothetical protein